MTDFQLVNEMGVAIAEALANMHTCTIARVTKITGSTISCKPVINRIVDNVSIELPEFSEVQVVVLQGGGSYIHFPIVAGDYVLLLFTERCYDGWYNGQDFKSPLEYRMHDYSDGLAICGINNMLSQISIPAVIQRTGDINQDGDVIHTGDKTQTGLFTLNGNMIMTGTGGPGTATLTNVTINITTGDIVVDGLSFANHVHGGVQTGGGVTGGPQ